jgi:hypothetical protein
MAICTVVDSISCQAPPGHGGRISTSCFSCGDAVCANCSLVIDYYDFGRKRIGHDCIRQRFGEHDERVYAHLWQLAGHSAEAGRSAAAEARASAEKSALNKAPLRRW